MRKKIAVIVGPALGHVVRVLAIANEIAIISKYEVVFISPDLQKFVVDLVDDRFKKILLPIKNKQQPYVEFAEQLEMIFSESEFSLIIFDMNPLRWLATTRFPETPQVYLSNIFLMRFAKEATLQTLQFNKIAETVNRIRKEKGLVALNDAFELYEKDLVCLADPPGFADAYSEKMPDSYFIGGALTYASQDKMLPEELSNIKNALLILLGSTGKIDFAIDTVKLLMQKNEFDAVIWVGTAITMEADWQHVITHSYTWLPLENLFEKTKMVITHGGAGSCYLALRKGLPIICCPTHANHLVFGQLLERLGLGVCLNSKSDIVKLQDMDMQRLNTQAQKIAQELEKINAPKKITARILQLIVS